MIIGKKHFLRLIDFSFDFAGKNRKLFLEGSIVEHMIYEVFLMPIIILNVIQFIANIHMYKSMIFYT